MRAGGLRSHGTRSAVGTFLVANATTTASLAAFSTLASFPALATITTTFPALTARRPVLTWLTVLDNDGRLLTHDGGNAGCRWLCVPTFAWPIAVNAFAALGAARGTLIALARLTTSFATTVATPVASAAAFTLAITPASVAPASIASAFAATLTPATVTAFTVSTAAALAPFVFLGFGSRRCYRRRGR